MGDEHTIAVGRRLIKKTQKTPLRELEIARKRMKDLKDANA